MEYIHVYIHIDIYKYNRLAQERKHQERRENRMAEKREQKLAPILSKMDAYKAKEDATMAMFKQMAEEQRKRGGL
jgi:hypothetical protein